MATPTYIRDAAARRWRVLDALMEHPEGAARTVRYLALGDRGANCRVCIADSGDRL